MIKHPITVAGALLAMFAVAGTGLVSFTHLQTKDQIARNEREALLKKLTALVPAASIDNDIIEDTISISSPKLLGGDNIPVFLGRKDNKPVAAVFASVVPDGYSGPIKLLIAVRVDGSLGGVRVVSHKETPGLGDKVETARSDWVFGFDGKSIGNPTLDRWKVKQDGGDFDQFTGATVTPRSIVNAVKNTLLYFKEHSGKLFKLSKTQPTEAGTEPQ
ncbi:MAG: electron transport complex subunit RsxG [Gammaproteobacteria bacterium]|nr:electron transport complex subunit RsxG [Gammaproteobacteria bacterium]